MPDQPYTDEAEFWAYTPLDISKIQNLLEKEFQLKLFDDVTDDGRETRELARNDGRLDCILDRKLTGKENQEEPPVIFWVNHAPDYISKDEFGQKVAELLHTSVHFGGVDPTDKSDYKLRISRTYEPKTPASE